MEKPASTRLKVALKKHLLGVLAAPKPQIVMGFDKITLEALHIRIVTPEREPEMLNGRTSGTWMMQSSVHVAEHVDRVGEGYQQLVERVEAALLDSAMAGGLRAAIKAQDATLVVNEVRLGAVREGVDQRGMCVTSFDVECAAGR